MAGMFEPEIVFVWVCVTGVIGKFLTERFLLAMPLEITHWIWLEIMNELLKTSDGIQYEVQYNHDPRSNYGVYYARVIQ